MGSPGSEDRAYILSVTIQDGKSFGPELQAIACAATFAGETKLTPYSVGRDSHLWNTTLQWRITMDQFRRLTSLGQKDCKVVLTNKDGTKLGWFLVDVRAAKLQAQYKKGEGSWVNLNGTKKGDTPQLCMLALFYEDRPGAFSSPEPKSPGKQKVARRQWAVNKSLAGAGVAEGAGEQSGAEAGGLSTSAVGGQPRKGDGSSAEAGGGGGPHRPPGAAGAPPTRNATAGLPNFGSPRRNPADDGPFRHFALTVDVRTFQSSKRLPLSSASVYSQAVLPAELIELVVGSGFRLPSRLAPLCSHPTVDIPRGAEGALPNAYGTVEFSAGVVELARVLAGEPRISVEAWHKERFRADMLLGAGSVPLTPLLQGAWVDGYAPLFAVIASSVAGEIREERVQMGMLRVVLSLEDKGPAPTPGGDPPAAAPPPAALPAPRADTSATGATAAAPLSEPAQPPPPAGQPAAQQQQQQETEVVFDEPAVIAEVLASAEGAPAGLASEVDGELRIREMLPPPPPAQAGQPAAAVVKAQAAGRAVVPPAHSRVAPPAVSMPSPPRLAREVGPLPVRGLGVPPGLQGAPEFEAAWELEVWKKAEEARWRSELREREAQRMLVLESEWRRRERAREAEIAGLKAEYMGLEDKAQKVLAAAEGRERRIVAAEEALLRRRKELEREHSARMVEAEAAVRRLQVECEHQLDIERDRNAELVRRVAMLEERLAASEMRCLTVENEFADFRAAARSTPEAELTRQLAEAREAAKAAESRAAKASKAKQGYKEQVRKLAEQLAAVQRRRNRDEEGALRETSTRNFATGLGLGLTEPVTADVSTIRAAAEEQARYAANQQQELATMRAQLQAIKAAALAQLSPPTSPRAGDTSRPLMGAAHAAAAAAAEPPAPARGGLDETADLRSLDQQRQGRSDWRGGPRKAWVPPHGGPAADSHPDASRPYTPHDPNPAGTPMHPMAPPRDSTTSSVDSTTASSGEAGRQQPGPTGVGNFSGWPTDGGYRPAGRWAKPRPAASAPVASVGSDSGRGNTGQQTSPAVSAPAAVPLESQAPFPQYGPAHPSSSSYQQDPHQAQQPQQLREGRQRRGWDPQPPARADRGRADALQHPDADRDPEGAWASPARRPPGSRPQPQGRQVASTSGPSGAEEQRRSLADHLASASVAAAQLPDRQPLPLPGTRGTVVGAGGASTGAAGQWQPVTTGVGAHGPSNSSADAVQQGSSGSRPMGPSGDPPVTTRSSGTSPMGGTVAGPQGYEPRGRWAERRNVAAQHQASGGTGSGPGVASGEAAAPRGAAERTQVGYRQDGGDGDEADGEPGGADEGLNTDLAEIQRLTRRKMELLQRGFGIDDPVVALLDQRIQALIAATAGLPVN